MTINKISLLSVTILMITLLGGFVVYAQLNQNNSSEEGMIDTSSPEVERDVLNLPLEDLTYEEILDLENGKYYSCVQDFLDVSLPTYDNIEITHDRSDDILNNTPEMYWRLSLRPTKYNKNIYTDIYPYFEISCKTPAEGSLKEYWEDISSTSQYIPVSDLPLIDRDIENKITDARRVNGFADFYIFRDSRGQIYNYDFTYLSYWEKLGLQLSLTEE